jgi:hypothetical protein
MLPWWHSCSASVPISPRSPRYAQATWQQPGSAMRKQPGSATRKQPDSATRKQPGSAMRKQPDSVHRRLCCDLPSTEQFWCWRGWRHKGHKRAAQRTALSRSGRQFHSSALSTSRRCALAASCVRPCKIETRCGCSRCIGQSTPRAISARNSSRQGCEQEGSGAPLLHVFCFRCSWCSVMTHSRVT